MGIVSGLVLFAVIWSMTFLIALPIIFWNLWAFVAPGLYANEKKVVVPFVTISTFLFVGGAFFGYSIVFPIMFNFFTMSSIKKSTFISSLFK